MIAIGIPTHGDIKCDTVGSLLSLSLSVDRVYLFAKGTYVHKNRNELVERALGGGASHLMFIDSDMVFPSFGVTRLIELDKDIVGGIYNRRELPLKHTVEFSGDFIPETPFKCDSVATGFMLIKMSVFQKIKRPHFSFEYDGERMLGEDVSFCRKARAAGIDIWCDPTIEIKHIGDYLY